MTHQYGGQMWLFATLGYNLFYLLSYFGFDSRSCCFTVN
jgi:hypothetical protein